MLRTTPVVLFIIALACSCATAPAKPSAPKPATPTVVVPTPAPEVSPDLAPASQVESPRKLGPGRCEESFDCVDTVGFPPPGQRWTCESGKCGHARLPDLNADASPADTEASADTSKDRPKAKKSRKRHD